MINKGIHNHPPKKLCNENQEMAGILIGARVTKQDVHGTGVFVPKRFIV
jgi:hypothetical protein